MKTLGSRSAARKIRGAVLTLGNFDGVHLGHQKIIRKVVARARALRCASAVFTFEPHPQKVLSPLTSPPLIASNEDRTRLIAGLGADFLILAKFTKDFASKHPGEFVEEAIVPMSVREIWVGHDFSFGKGKTGTAEYLKSLGGEFGFRVFEIPAYKKGGQIVSSSRIRGLVKTGRVGEASRLLGRNFSITGAVVRGKRAGSDLGFPTANIKVRSELVPGRGVYAAYAFAGGRKHLAAVNVGVAPTLGAVPLCVEAHLLDFKGNMYGKTIVVEFVKRLRDETPFTSTEALVRRIEKDVAIVRRILAKGQ